MLAVLAKIHLFERPLMVLALLSILILSLTLIMLREKLLRGVTVMVIKKPMIVLGVAAAITLGSLASLPFLKVSTSRTNLLDDQNEIQRQLTGFLKEFGNPNHLIAVVEGGTLDQRHAVADAMAEALKAEPKHFKSVFHKVDLKQMRRQALLYVPLEELESLKWIVNEPKGARKRLMAFLAIRDLAGLLRSLSTMIETAINQPMAPLLKKQDAAGKGLKLIEALFAEMGNWLKNPTYNKIFEELKQSYLKRFDPAKANLDPLGYLADKRYKRLYIFIRPATDSDETVAMLPMVKRARELAKFATKGKGGVRIKFTGYPALLTDEMQIIQRDMFTTTIIAMVGIMFIFMLVFRAVRQAALALVALLVGLMWTVGFTVIVYGGFNLVTSLFGAILLGLGIDFGIHINARYNEARAAGMTPAEAVEKTIMGVGPGLLTGGLITATVFYTTAISEFTAFSQLGVIAGTGMLFTLIAALSILPALLMVNPGKISKLSEPGRGKKRAFAVRLLIRWPVAIVIVGAVVTVAAMLTPEPPLNYNLITLMPKELESRRAYTKMIEESNFKGEFIGIIVKTIQEARDVSKELKKYKNVVASVEHIGMMVPPNQNKKLAIIEGLRLIFKGLKAAWKPPLPEIDPEKIDEALTDVQDAFEDAAILARRHGHQADNQALLKVRKRVEDLRKLILAKGPDGETVVKPGAKARLDAFQNKLFGMLRAAFDELIKMLDPKKITPKKLPAFARARYMSRTGKPRFAIYVYPKMSIWDRVFLGKFVKATSKVAGKRKAVATGFPITYYAHAKLLKEGLEAAAFLATVAIVLLLLLDFTEGKYAVLGLVPLAVMAVWSHQMSGWAGASIFLLLMLGIMAVFDVKAVGYMFLALIPTGMGALWMLAMMWVFKVEYNLANIVALPLLLGIGVVYNVHILHRFRQEGEVDVFRVVRHTGSAVLLSALTTMIGFAAIGASAHRGMKIMGLTMLIGVGTCMLSALLVLPAIMRLLPKVRRAEKNAKAETAELVVATAASGQDAETTE